jgi:mono/diheme cytochrome c family protein
MINQRKTARIFFLIILIVSGLLPNTSAWAQPDGKALFMSNCSSCHGTDKAATGPALAGADARMPSADLLHTWVRNWEDAVATGDPYAVKIAAYAPSVMNKFPKLKDEEIDAIIKYANDDKAAKDKAAATVKTTGGGDEAGSDNSLLYGILTLILGIIALTLLYVNANLRKISEEKDGVASPEPIPFYRNKTYILCIALLAFVMGGYWVAKGATALGRSKDYQPEQPIFYSHKVHAGLNQINCLYCHGAAQDSRHAMIPSVNVCMNCHMNIKEYNGPKIYDGNGKEVNGTAEIKKLFEYAGYGGNPGEIWQPSEKTKPVEWVKIHNLPDHVYFNHSQHVKVGGVACQTCHGEIEKMDEVKQFSNLSMGWCVNCHRNTGVNFSTGTDSASGGNRFYNMYSKLHEELKSDELNKVKNDLNLSDKEKRAKTDSLMSLRKKSGITVSDIGGTECQKCHY